MSDLHNLIEKIRHSSRDMVRELGLLSKTYPYELPLSFRHVLIELESHGALSHIELAALLKLDKSTISRIIKKLIQQKLVMISADSKDQRYKHILLTATGKNFLEKIHQIANQQVQDALLQLSEAEQQKVNIGIELYVKGLKRSRLKDEFIIRPIKKTDNLEIMMIINKMLKEYVADGSGLAFIDPELENMHKSYSKKQSSYFVIERKVDKKIVGGAGIASLFGSKASICELKKMYLLADVRGLGLGCSLLQKILNQAKEYGYKQCYLETLKSMFKANGLYKKFGFTSLNKAMGDTGHYSCDAWYIKNL